MKKQKPVVIIPARGGSKRFPGKNIELWKYTSCFLQENKDIFDSVYVATDSEELKRLVLKDGFSCVERDSSLSIDELPVSPVLSDVISRNSLYDRDICMMYLTSPDRRRKDFTDAIKEYYEEKLESIVSFYRPKYSPYLAKFEDDLSPLVSSSAYRSSKTL